MNDQDAAAVLETELAALRAEGYEALARRVGGPGIQGERDARGATYQVEIEFRWDDRPGGNVHVLGAIDDGRGWRAFVPLTRDFVMAPDGSLVGG